MYEDSQPGLHEGHVWSAWKAFRYPMPTFLNALLRASSGLVSAPLMRDMICDRVRGLRLAMSIRSDAGHWPSSP
jgi:hypothetical protein